MFTASPCIALRIAWTRMKVEQALAKGELSHARKGKIGSEYSQSSILVMVKSEGGVDKASKACVWGGDFKWEQLEGKEGMDE